MKTCFDHEKLKVYHNSLGFITWAEENVLSKVPKSLSAWDQLDRASTSVPLNIAEGNGKFTSADRCRYFDNARGSAVECAACLDVFVAKGRLTKEQIDIGKENLVEIVSMLVGLIKSNSTDRFREESVSYSTERESERQTD